MRGGITGLAQANGRNALSWEKKLGYDVEYVKNITFFGDLKILFMTVNMVLFCKGICEDGQATHEEAGKYLLRTGKITEQEYLEKKALAEKTLRELK